MKIVGIIPARYQSTRFPGKPLATIAGKPMIQHVVEQCRKSKLLDSVIVATDDERIANAVTNFGGEVVFTKPTHSNGTERVAEAATLPDKPADFIINIQGDEPLIAPEQIDEVCEFLKTNRPQIATLVRPMNDKEQVQSANVVKCVITKNGEALYFSRSPIPFARNQVKTYYQHIGLYAFAADVLQQIVQLEPGELEQAESLEQLRWLENGFTISTLKTDRPTFGVDVVEDSAIIEKQLNETS